MKNIKLSFKGYWREEKHEHIPHFMGVYLVYRCVFNESSDTVSLVDLIYIGRAEDVNSRIEQHCNDPRFNNMCHNGETLCFSVAEVDSSVINLVENALIFAQQPPMNEQGRRQYNYEDASFDIEGRCSMLKYTSFTITNS